MRELASVHLFEARNTMQHMNTVPLNPGNRSLPRLTDADLLHGSVVLTNVKGVQEVFAIRPDRYVWHHLVGRYADSAARLFCTGLPAHVFNVAALPDGRRMVLGAQGLSLQFCVETAADSGRWHAPRDVPMNPPEGTICIDKIMLRTKDDLLLIGVVTQRASPGGYRLLELWDGTWVNETPIISKVPRRARSSASSAWQKRIADELPEVQRSGPVYQLRQTDERDSVYLNLE